MRPISRSRCSSLAAVALVAAGCSSGPAAPSPTGLTAVASATPTLTAPPTVTPTTMPPSPSPGIQILGDGGFIFPGRYQTAFQPSMRITINDVVDLDCSPGNDCRGDIDVNLPQWVGFEFGNVHGSELDVQGLDKVYAGPKGDAVVDVPDDLAAWIVAQPGVTEVTPAVDVSVGGLPGKRLELRADRDVRFGPSGMTEFPTWGIGPNGFNGKRSWLTAVKVGHVGVLIWEGFGPDNTAGDFDAITKGLQPVIDSITWG